MGYLLPTEYVQYGLTAETTDDWVTMASALMEAHCRRPSLLVTQYVERMRLTAGAQTVRLSYRPLAAAVGAVCAGGGAGAVWTAATRGDAGSVSRAGGEGVWFAGKLECAGCDDCGRECDDGGADISGELSGAGLQRG